MEEEIIEPITEINLNRPEYKGYNEIELIIPDDWGFEQRGNKMFGVRKQPQYPKDYKSCCEVLGYEGGATVIGYDAVLLNSFQKLKLCRDTYWKIAGEQMGLGKPWEPNWENENEYKYGLFRLKNIIYKDATCINPVLLIFPTVEMRDAFKENFGPEIENCKELL